MAMSISLISASPMRDISTGGGLAEVFLLVAAMLGVLAALPSPVQADPGQWLLQLVMVESNGCRFCDLWHEEIGRTYAATPEGRRAPLVRLGIGSAAARRFPRIVYTPTFILVRTDGQEIGRIIGYPGADFFWGDLARLLSRAGRSNPSPALPGGAPSHTGPSPARY